MHAAPAITSCTPLDRRSSLGLRFIPSRSASSCLKLCGPSSASGRSCVPARRNFRMNTRMRTDVLLLVAFCGFLFFYGLGAFGLLGADEPRYAQVAREMLERHDWITPTLQGKPWLEKPALYYWQAMLSFSIFGVTDQAARIPVAVDAALMIAAI